MIQANGAAFIAGAGAVPVSWQGVNDLSAHPATTGPNHLTITPTTLRGADDRAEHAFARSRTARTGLPRRGFPTTTSP